MWYGFNVLWMFWSDGAEGSKNPDSVHISENDIDAMAEMGCNFVRLPTDYRFFLHNFDILNLIDNFLKHNTVRAYNSLANNPFEKDEQMKKFQSEFVYSKEEKGYEYENGMYAGDWLKIDSTFVDKTLSNLQEFANEFCALMYNEDSKEATWNSDEALLKILRDNFIDFM